MLLSEFKPAPFEQSPRAYRSGMVEIKAHKDFKSGSFSYSLVKGHIRNREIESFLWAFLRDFFSSKRKLNDYCSGKTFIHKTRVSRTYGVVIEGKAFKYNVRIERNTDKNGVNFYIVVNKKTSAEAA